jgi:hypothetical protein
MGDNCEPVSHEVRLAVIEERLRGDDKEWEVFKKYAEGRWENLNGEAGRLKAILDSSVTREKFEDYRDSQRKALEEYREAQTLAFNKYADEVGTKLASINKQIARWSGGIAAIVIVIELWIKYGGGGK